MADEVCIERLTIAGFRAFLREQSFKLFEGKRAKSLAVFAPNAKGKSSLVDAIEYYFSDDGTLERLGKRQSVTQAGPEALAHVDAIKKKIKPCVTMHFREGSDQFSDARDLSKASMAKLPDAATRVIDQCNTSFIIRGYELRRFVEDRTSQARYEDVSHWLKLSPLLEVQRNLRDLRLKLSNRICDDPTLTERLRDLKRITKNKLTEWNDQLVLDWINETYLKPLDDKLQLTDLDKKSLAYETVKARKKTEDDKIGLTSIKAAHEAVTALFEKDAAQDDGSKKDIGAIVDLEDAVNDLATATATEQKERAAAEKSAFKTLWIESKKVLSDSENLADCPVCDTPFSDSPHGSKDQVLVRIKADLGELKSYSEADDSLKTAKRNTTGLHSSLRTKLRTAVTMLKAAGYDEENMIIREIDSLRESLGEKFQSPMPKCKALKSLLKNENDGLAEKKEQIESEQNEITYGKALEIIDKVSQLEEQLIFLRAKKEELEKIQGSLEKTERFIARKLRGYLQALIDKLQDRMKDIYAAVQPDSSGAPSIRFELDENSKQPQLHLLADFSENKKGVVPSGYLSDSQLHTLALSLRIASIEKANGNAPIIVLDDVVTSYDSDHRKAIAAVMASELSGFQIIIVTHDELFYQYLEEHLPRSSWQFKRIKSIEEDFGPRFHDHMVTDEMIQSIWKNGDPASNEIRQAEEEWLTKKAREFGVDVRIRDVNGAHRYDRGELAIAIQKFLKDTGVEVPKVKGIKNPFFTSLQKGNVENFGSHFSDDPNAWGSIGDEKKRWSEFEEFCSLFVCKCGSKRFKRPKVGVSKALCAKCETPFAFSAH